MLLSFRGIHTIYLSHGAVVRRVSRDDIDAVGIMLDPVQDGFSQRAVITPELVIPAFECVLGAEDRRGLFPPPMQQFHDVALFSFRWFQEKPFIDDQKDRVGILGQNLFIAVIRTCEPQLKQEIRQADV